MGLKSLPHSEWFELDNEYATYQRIRRGRIESKGREILRIIPSDKVGDGAVVRGARIVQGGEQNTLGNQLREVWRLTDCRSGRTPARYGRVPGTTLPRVIHA